MNKKRIFAVIIALVLSVCAAMLVGCSKRDQGEPSVEPEYTVTFYGNGGYFDDSRSTHVETVKEGEYAKGTYRPTHPDGHTFKGWGDERTSTVTVDLSTRPVTEDAKYYALWNVTTPEPPPVPVTHTVTFYYNYIGSPATIYKTASANDGGKVTAPAAPSRGGNWEFAGWYTETVGGTQWAFDTATVSKDTKLYAHWTSTLPQPELTGITVTPTSSTTYVEGQTFRKSDMTVVAHYSNGGADDTLGEADYTVSEPDMTRLGQQTVTVTYNGHTDDFTINIIARAVETVTVLNQLTNKTQYVGALFDASGLSFRVQYNDKTYLTPDPTKDDMVFTSAEWLNGDGTLKKAGAAEITVSYDGVAAATKITLTVQEPAKPQRNVTFEKNNSAYAADVKNMPSPVTVDDGEAIGAVSSPALKGFTFGGWYRNAECTGAAWTLSDPVTSGMVLYAKWTANVYTVSYNSDGGAHTNPTQFTADVSGAHKGEFVPVTLNNASRAHSTFNGWYTDPGFDASSKVTKISLDLVKAGSLTITLYASFTPDVYDINVSWGDGQDVDYTAALKSGMTIPATHTFGIATELPEISDVTITVIKSGEAVKFSFMGWYYYGDTTKTHISSIAADKYDASFKTEGIIIVADIVEADTRTVTFVWYEGKSETKLAVDGGKVARPAPDPTRDGYTFDGWFTAATGGSAFSFDQTITTDTVTAYAHWTHITYKVTYHNVPDGATNSNPATYHVDDNVTGTVTLVALSDLDNTAGYRASGWYSDPAFKNVKTTITPADIATAQKVGSDYYIYIYAKCSNLYTVTFMSNVTGETVTDMPDDIDGDNALTYGATLTRPSRTPSRDNYTFTGWYKDAACNNAWTFAGAGTPDTVGSDRNDVVLYAGWIANPDDGVYLLGTANDSDIHDEHISDYKGTVTSVEGATVYTFGEISLAAGDSYKVGLYTKKTGDLEWVVATTVTVHPQAGMTVAVQANVSYAVTASTLASEKWDISVTAPEAGTSAHCDMVLHTADGYMTLRAPNVTSGGSAGTEVTDAEPTAGYIVGNMTADKLYTEWSTASTTVGVAAVGTKTVLQGIVLCEKDEFRLVMGGVSFGGEFAIDTEKSLSPAADNIYVTTSGTYNIVVDNVTGKYTICETVPLTAAKVAAAKIYDGEDPAAAGFDRSKITVTYGETGSETTLAAEDYAIIAQPAEYGKTNTITVVYLAKGAIASFTYDAEEVIITNVEIKTEAPAAKKEYFVGDAIDLSDVVLLVTYNNGSTAEVDGADAEKFGFEIDSEYYDTAAASPVFLKKGTVTVTLKAFGNATYKPTMTVTVYDKLTSIEITDPTTLTYVANVASTLDLTGLAATVYYNNTDADSEVKVTATYTTAKTETYDGYVVGLGTLDLTSPAKYDITVSYTQSFPEGSTKTAITLSKTFKVTVEAAKITRVEATVIGTLAAQSVGGEVVGTGIKFIGKYNDNGNTTDSIIAVSDIVFDATDANGSMLNSLGQFIRKGTATLSGKYTNSVGDEIAVTFAAPVTVTVNDTLTSVHVTVAAGTSFPQNTVLTDDQIKAFITVTANYNEGVAEIDEDDIVIGQTYTGAYDVTASLVTVGDTAGTVTVTVGALSDTANFKVTAPKLASVTFDATGLTKTEYFVGESFAPAGLTVSGTLDNGLAATLTLADFRFNNNAALVKGDSVTVPVSYIGTAVEAVDELSITGDITVAVYDKLTAIVTEKATGTAPHTNSANFVAGDTLTDEALVSYGLVVKARYNDAETGGDAITGYTTNAAEINMTSAGEKTLTVTYIEHGITKTAEFKFTVVAEAIYALVCTNPASVVTQYNNQPFNASGLIFKAVYNNDREETVTSGITYTATCKFNGVEVDAMDGGKFNTATDNATVTATYMTKTCTITGVRVDSTPVREITFVKNIGYDVTGMPETEYIVVGDKVPEPADPSCNGFTFEGWFTSADGNDEWDFDTVISAAKTLYAHWTPNNYTVMFVYGANTTYAYTATAGLFPETAISTMYTGATPAQTGYDFMGWTYSDAPDNDHPITTFTQAHILHVSDVSVGGTTLHYIYLTPIFVKQQFTVTFKPNNGGEDITATVEYNDTVTVPASAAALTRKGYTSYKWYTAADCATEYTMSTPVTGNVTLHAGWTAKTYTVTYVLDSGANHEDNPASYTAGEAGDVNPVYAAVTLKAATRTGYDFKGWYDNDEFEGDAVTQIDLDLMGETGVTLYAKFEIQVMHVTFKYADGATADLVKDVNYGAKVTAAAESVYAHHDFDGWFKAGEEESFDFDTAITADLELTAHWTETEYTITYVLPDTTNYTNGGNATVVTLSAPVTLANATTTLNNKVFVAWKDDSAKVYTTVTVNDFVDADTPLVLTAEFGAKAEVTVRFNSKGGDTTPDAQTFVAGEKATDPGSVNRTGYTFDGWFSDEACTAKWNFNTAVTSGMTLYAGWTAEKRTVTFNYNDGATPTTANVQVDYDTAVATRTPESREGYTFKHWYLSTDMTKAAYNFATKVTDNIELVALWEANKYTVTYKYCYDKADTSEELTYPAVITNTAPEREGYTFGGWFEGYNSATGVYDTPYAVNTPVAKALTLYAKWDVITYKVSFDLNYTGAAAATEVNVNASGKVTPPADPTRTGYEFGGWFSEKSPAATDVAIDFTAATYSENKTVYAKWTAISAMYYKSGDTYTLITKMDDNGSTDSRVKLMAEKVILNKDGVIAFYHGGAQLAANSVFVRNNGSDPCTTRITTGKTGAANNGTLVVSGLAAGKTTGTFNLYYDSYNNTAAGKDNEYGFWIVDLPDYVAPSTLENAIYVDGTKLCDLETAPEAYNKVIKIDAVIAGADETDTTMHTVTLKYNGVAVTDFILNVKSGIATDPAVTETSTDTVSSFKLYSGTYSFYYAYAESNDCVANRLWVQGTQAGGPQRPAGVIELPQYGVYLTGTMNGLASGWGYGLPFTWNEGRGEFQLLYVKLAVGDTVKLRLGTSDSTGSTLVSGAGESGIVGGGQDWAITKAGYFSFFVKTAKDASYHPTSVTECYISYMTEAQLTEKEMKIKFTDGTISCYIVDYSGTGLNVTDNNFNIWLWKSDNNNPTGASWPGTALKLVGAGSTVNDLTANGTKTVNMADIVGFNLNTSGDSHKTGNIVPAENQLKNNGVYIIDCDRAMILTK